MDFLELAQEFSDMEPDEGAQLSGSELAIVLRALRLAALVEDAEAFLRQETRFELSTGEKVANAKAILARIVAAKAGGE
jgi:hypothetical protein